jgi:hypothetical protein
MERHSRIEFSFTPDEVTNAVAHRRMVRRRKVML